jgi:hypothetical protein
MGEGVSAEASQKLLKRTRLPKETTTAARATTYDRLNVSSQQSIILRTYLRWKADIWFFSRRPQGRLQRVVRSFHWKERKEEGSGPVPEGEAVDTEQQLTDVATRL